MPWNLLLLPLLGGFIFLSHWNRTAFFAKRQDKERLLFYSALWGALFLGLSFLLSIFLVPYNETLTRLRYWWANNTPPIKFFGISSCALLLGVAGHFVLNRLWPFSRLWTEKKEGVRAIKEYGSELEKLLLTSLENRKHVMVTLKTGKVYIGRVANSLSPKEDTHFMLLPSNSGYRDEKHRFRSTIDYDKIYTAIAQAVTEYKPIIADFGVVIPISEVLSASLYRRHVEVYFAEDDSPDEAELSERESIVSEQERVQGDTENTLAVGDEPAENIPD